VLGGGGFGRALALAAARAGRRVLLWSRATRPVDHSLVTPIAELAALAEAELVFVAVPSIHVDPLVSKLGAHLDGSHLLVHVSRGLLGDELGTLTELCRTRTPVRRVGALAGPLVAKALAQGQPGGGIVGSLFPEVSEAVRDAIGGATLRIYGTQDVVGVEVASAFVGLMALSLGYAQQLGFGPGTLAMLATRGMTEAARVGVARGGLERTFSGLAGYGDLTAAVAGDGRPEWEFGRAIADGLALERAAERAGAFVEGATIAAQVTTFADRYKLEVPISNAIADMLAGRLSGRAVLEQLMARPVGQE
jgi:glycerol-3-phosphate dehydrogenase (NAD(P)+)